MSNALANQLRMMARTRSDTDAHMMAEAADELDRKEAQIDGLIRAVELIAERVAKRADEIYTVITQHLGPP